MSDDSPGDRASVADHYAVDDLGRRILAAAQADGIDLDALTCEILAPIDQLHTRGWEATVELARLGRFEPAMRVLDVGCGLGGGARYLARQFGSDAVALDLTEAFLHAGRMLTARLGMESRVSFVAGTATSLPFAAACFDAVWAQNVAMNIADKAAFYGEIARVLRPGGRFLATEVVQGPGGDIHLPVPWARGPEHNFLATIDDMQAALAAAGLRTIEAIDDSAQALSTNRRLRAQPRPQTPPQLGPRLVFGADIGTRAKNNIRNLEEERIRNLKIVAERVV